MVTRIRDGATFGAWYSTTKTALSGEPSQTQILAKLDEIYKTNKCIQDKLFQQTTIPTQVSTDVEKILELERELRDREEQVRVAQDRAALLRAPQEHASFYESWFPLGRPMKTFLVPVFLGLGLFMGLMALFLFLKFLGVEFALLLPVMTTQRTASFSIPRLDPLWVGTILVIALAWWYLRKKSSA